MAAGLGRRSLCLLAGRAEQTETDQREEGRVRYGRQSLVQLSAKDNVYISGQKKKKNAEKGDVAKFRWW